MLKRTMYRQSNTSYGDAVVPRLVVLRHVAPRFQKMLPLAFMKRYQCVIVGGSQSSITVAIADRASIPVLEMVHLLTGCRVTPVLAHPEQIDLLLQRIERAHCACRRIACNHILPRRVTLDVEPVNVHTMLQFFTTLS